MNNIDLKQSGEKNETIAIAIAIIFLSLIMGIGLIIMNQSNTPVEETSAPVESPTVTPQVNSVDNQMDTVKDLYIYGCMTEGAGYEYCECTYNYLDANVDDLPGLFIQFEETQNFTDEMFDAVNNCLHRL